MLDSLTVQNNGVPIYVQLRDQILGLIGRGALRPGSQLPTMRQVAVALKIDLNTVQRAGKKGIRRRRSQTPREFTATLAPRLAEAEGDMEALTDAFITARYSRREVPQGEMGRIRGSWQRVKAALRGVRGG